MPLAAALQRRRSVRAFAARALAPAELGQLLWAAQGEADARDGVRTAPSAGALYPLVLFVAMANGLFRYVVEEHALEQVSSRDLRGDLAAAALGSRRSPKRRACSRSGHAAQNALLTATALGLAGYPVGAFDDARVAQLPRLGRGEVPLYLVPVGAPRFAAQGGR
jgi:nitroreductase